MRIDKPRDSMEDAIKIKLAEDEALFYHDVESLVRLLASKKGGIEHQLYFQQAFPKYMRQLQRTAQGLVEKYSLLLTREELGPLKISLQKTIEEGLEKLYKMTRS